MCHTLLNPLSSTQIEAGLVDRIADDEHIIHPDPQHQDWEDGPEVTVLPPSHVADGFATGAGDKDTDYSDDG